MDAVMSDKLYEALEAELSSWIEFDGDYIEDIKARVEDIMNVLRRAGI
jgi:hypothetical protein